MHIEHHQWWSHHLNRDMVPKVYGHWGKPFIVFPCSRGRYFDYEGMGMIEAIAGFINAGKLKLFCVDRFDCLLTSFFAECYVRIPRTLILEGRHLVSRITI